MFHQFRSLKTNISILLISDSFTALILLLKEFTFNAPIVTFLAFSNLCTVTDGKAPFLALSSAELFLLKYLLLSTFRFTGLSILELFTLKTFFFYHLRYCRFFFSILFLAHMQLSSHQAFILKQKLLTRHVLPYSFKLIPLLFNIFRIIFLLSINDNCLLPNLLFNNSFIHYLYFLIYHFL